MICMGPRRAGREARTACTDYLPNRDTNAREDMRMQGVEKRETFAQNVVLLHISMPIRRFADASPRTPPYKTGKIKELGGV